MSTERKTHPPSPPADPPRKNWNAHYRVETYRGEDLDHRFRVVASSNGEIVASGEGYARQIDMLATLRRLFPEAEV